MIIFEILLISIKALHSELLTELSCRFLSRIRVGFPQFPNFTELFQTLWPKNKVFDSKTQTLHTFFKIFKIYVHFQIISELFCKNFASSKIPFFSEKFPNFDSRTFPKLAKLKSSENSV